MRVGVVGLGVIGKRVAHALASSSKLELVGVAVRSVPAALYALPGLTYHADDETVRNALRKTGVSVAGGLGDLLATADVVVDAGTARTGARRAQTYRDAGVRAVFCGGERDPALGPLVHSALNFALARPSWAVRLASCNTTAMGRVVAALQPSAVRGLDAVVLRCCTDTDKAGKGRTDGAGIGGGQSHHAADLRAVAPGISATSAAVTVPMTCGHVIHLRVQTALLAPDAASSLGGDPRVVVTAPGVAIDTAMLQATASRSGRPWSQRFELVVQVEQIGPGTLQCWLSLDNESITVPELIDVLFGWAGAPTAVQARALTNELLALRTDSTGRNMSQHRRDDDAAARAVTA